MGSKNSKPKKIRKQSKDDLPTQTQITLAPVHADPISEKRLSTTAPAPTGSSDSQTTVEFDVMISYW